MFRNPWGRGGLQFVAGGLAYNTLEILWRGYTHISMMLLGGICFVALVRLAGSLLPLLVQCFLGAALITAGELLTGCVVNLWLRLNVWDYSAEAFDLWGQICPKFAALWFGLCALLLPAIRAARGFKWKALRRRA